MQNIAWHLKMCGVDIHVKELERLIQKDFIYDKIEGEMKLLVF